MNLIDSFGSMVFNEQVMRERLPKDTFRALQRTIELGKKLDPTIANINAMKDWAIEKGATHFTHWFQPMTGITAEKHDSFISPHRGRAGLSWSSLARSWLKASRMPPASPPAGCGPPLRPGATPPGIPPPMLLSRTAPLVHSHGVLFLRRRGAGQKGPASAIHGGDQHGRLCGFFALFGNTATPARAPPR